eukprot:gnl/MRDRNA2_/MRDRNA2_58520_c0_seq1.p1 gnl/MRDRNA2_/MRDRNA2_58520_c0~~gnl/MRDRNA2_/MRDRNA2_58520_c0_seq1.p1  ORF type:complete len:542 (+),score=91.43 gnl/MRDRNA2_/MRDRNA2_58520_c0_seq1:52-1626(+)
MPAIVIVSLLLALPAQAFTPKVMATLEHRCHRTNAHPPDVKPLDEVSTVDANEELENLKTVPSDLVANANVANSSLRGCAKPSSSQALRFDGNGKLEALNTHTRTSELVVPGDVTNSSRMFQASDSHSVSNLNAVLADLSIIKQPASTCKLTDSESIWARYIKSPKNGILRFNGNSRGQGIGNVLGGVAKSVLLALHSGRELVIDYDISGKQLSDIVPANKDGPTWKYRMGDPCSAQTSDFNFGGATPPNEILNKAMDASAYPVLCHSGNFGQTEFTKQLSNMVSPSLGTLGLGCALNYLFDTTKFQKYLTSGAFNFVGHLRFGDAHMDGGGDPADRRDILSNPNWSLHDIKLTGVKFVECMQGVMKSLPTLQESDHHGCTIVVVSDNSEVKSEIQSQALRQPCAVKVTASKAQHSATRTFDNDGLNDMFTDFFTLGSADAAMLTQSGFGISGSSMGPSLSHHSYQFEDFLQAYHESGTNQNFEEFCHSKALTGATSMLEQHIDKYARMIDEFQTRVGRGNVKS